MENNSSQPQQRKRSCRRLTRCCQNIYRHLYAQLLMEKEKGLLISVERVFARMNIYTGVSKATFHRHAGEEVEICPDAGVPEKKDRGVAMTEEEENLIRPALLALFADKVTPTVYRLLMRLKDENPEWSYGRTTVYRTLIRLGFSFDLRSKRYYDRIRESPEQIALRIRYLTRYVEAKSQNRYIVYMDETWINKNIAPKRVWSGNGLENQNWF